MANKISIENNDLPEDKKTGALKVDFNESSIKNAKKSIKQHKRKRLLMFLSLVLFLTAITRLIFVWIKRIKLEPISLTIIMAILIISVILEIFYLKTEKYI